MAVSGRRCRVVGQQAAAALGFEPRIRFDGPVDAMDARIAQELLASLREALSNVTKHAQGVECGGPQDSTTT